MTTAFVGAGVVALGFGTVLPDHPNSPGLALVDVSLDGSLPTDLATRTVVDRSSRSDPRTFGDTAAQAAPDVWVLPLRSYSFSSPFGYRWGRLHAGVDLAADYGAQYQAAARGRVILAGWYGGYGNFVLIDHGDGFVTGYAHQSQIAVSCGEHVSQGQTLGYVGCTGHCFGPHLHFEVRINGSPVDPLGYL
jgi:murein DD-endopeptidase MepM/ murein hydrolase activator NlpD